MHVLRNYIVLVFFALMVSSPVAKAGEVHYHYDARSQLTRSEYIGLSSIEYEYDDIGNRSLMQISTGGTATNVAPYPASSPVPGDGSIDVDPLGLLSCSGIDPNANDILIYDFYFGTDPDPSLVDSQLSVALYQPPPLNSFTTYYWKVTTQDNYNTKTVGPVWSFTTGNSSPLTPENMLPADGCQLGYLYTTLQWSCPGDPNLNDNVTYDIYFGTTIQPPLYLSDQNVTQVTINGLTPNISYYWRVVAKDNHGAETPGPTFSFSVIDSDNDGMPDQWEQDYGLDPLSSDADGHADHDAITNLQECNYNTDPTLSDSYPVEYVESFETGDFSKFHWMHTGGDNWTVSDAKPLNGAFAAQSPALPDASSAAIETVIVCDAGEISFYYSVSSESDKDYLKFYIDDVLQDSWSGEVPYVRIDFPVTAGTHTFKWVYSKDASGSAGDDKAWVDVILFPGPVDNDADGIVDGWEIVNFGSLEQNLCADSDGDSLSDLMEGAYQTDPLMIDTDGDGMSDFDEITHSLNPLIDDAFGDADNDGFNNIDEVTGGSDPNSFEEQPLLSFEGFETRDLSRFFWIKSGDGNWQVNDDKPYAGGFSAQTPLLDHNQSAGLETTIVCTTGRIRFFVSTSSESGADTLQFYIDGILTGEWSGDITYQEVIFDVSDGTRTFKWVYSKNGDISEYEDSAWIDNITFPGSADADNDGVVDGWELHHFSSLTQNLCGDTDGDGLSDLAEAVSYTDPSDNDSDQDGLTDDWEITNGLDPFSDDAFLDADNDGVSNYDEFIGNSDPNDYNDKPYLAFESFETGDLSRYYWVLGGNGQWAATDDLAQHGSFAAQTPYIGNSESVSLETTMNCIGEQLSFYLAISSQDSADYLKFYIDDQLQAQWSGDHSYAFEQFDVTPGIHDFKWEYAKDASLSEFEDTAWIDAISFPGQADSDGDGIRDGWEYLHFNGLNHDMCLDSDNEGLIDLEEAMIATDPFNTDTDQDGYTDKQEFDAGTNALDATSYPGN